MGSIFKRKHKRPIPENAEIVVKRGTTRAEWIAKDGRKHRAPVAKNGRQIQTESQAYYIKYRDENDLWQIENTGAAEVATARQVLHTREERVAKVRAGIINPAALCVNLGETTAHRFIIVEGGGDHLTHGEPNDGSDETP